MIANKFFISRNFWTYASKHLKRVLQQFHTLSSFIMSCRQHGYPWSSLATSPYRSSPLAGLQGYIPYPHIPAVCMFELVVLLYIYIYIYIKTICFNSTSCCLFYYLLVLFIIHFNINLFIMPSLLLQYWAIFHYNIHATLVTVVFSLPPSVLTLIFKIQRSNNGEEMKVNSKDPFWCLKKLKVNYLTGQIVNHVQASRCVKEWQGNEIDKENKCQIQMTATMSLWEKRMSNFKK